MMPSTRRPDGPFLHTFGHRDKPDAELLAARLDRRVVGEVPREAIDLVDDGVRDVAVLLEQRCHGLEGGAVRGARGLAELGEFVLDGPALLDGEAAASLQLGLDRVAALGLLARGDPDVDDVPAHARFLDGRRRTIVMFSTQAMISGTEGENSASLSI